MNFKELINGIDWNKNIIMLIIYSAVIVVYIHYYLMPIVNAHKENIINYKRANNIENKISINKSEIENKLKEKLEQTRITYKELRKNIEIKEIQEYIKKYISNVNIKEIGKQIIPEQIEITTLKITGELKKSIDIIDLVNNINNVKNSIRVSLPIDIKKDSNKIKVDFIIDIYRSTYKSNNI